MAEREDVRGLGETAAAGADTAHSLGGYARPTTGGGRLERGSQLGKYLVLERIGAGGAGIVVAAFDPDLDRKVAIKVLRGHANDVARVRLAREAKALAQLNHPNVITVHEVGTFDGEMFVAMEFAERGTLGAWLRGGPRPWREIIDRFVQAGRGLAAAHAAKLVHRDFKPENVLVTGDGRVKVSDFGLVGVANAAPEPGDAGAAPAAPADMLTHTGMLLGTPAYMAPEQHRLGRVDARADQFAFCVALHEALYGMRPFAGDDYESLLDSVSSGKLVPPPAAPDVPPRILRVVQRGLATDPAARWESMDALLTALEGERPPRRGWYVAAAIATAGIAAVVVAIATRSTGRDPEPCAGGARRLAGIWDVETKQKIHAGFAASAVITREVEWSRVEKIVDGYAQAWLDSHRDNCMATRVYGEQNEHAFGLRESCLDYRLAELSGLTGLWLGRLDADVVRAASVSAVGLDALSICGDVSALSDRMPPPSDEASRRAIAQIRSRVAEATVRINAGKYAEAKAILGPLRSDADRLGYAPLEAEVEMTSASLAADLDDEHGAEELAFDAAVRAQASGDYETAAHSWLRLAGLASNQARYPEAERWFRLGRAAATALGDDPVQAYVTWSEGTLRQNQGKLDEARERLEAAAAQYERYLARGRGTRPRLETDLASVRGDLGNVLMTMGRNREAEPTLLGAIASFDALYGPSNLAATTPLNSLAGIYYASGEYGKARVIMERILETATLYIQDPSDTLATYHTNLGQLLRLEGSFAAARDHVSRAMETRRALFGDDDPRLVNSYANLARIDVDDHRLDEARRYAELAVAVGARKLGDTPKLAFALMELANVLEVQGKHDEAIAQLRRALRIYEAAAPGAEDVAAIHDQIGTSLREGGKLRAAVAEHREALAAFEHLDKPAQDAIADTLGNLARDHVALGEHATAVPLLERALAVDDRADVVGAPRHASRAAVRFVLAQALWDSRIDRARATREAADALAECEAAKPCKRAPIESWLASHR